MNDINNKEIKHPAYLKLDNGDVVFTVSTKNGISFFGEKLSMIEALTEENVQIYKIVVLDRISIKANEELFYSFQMISKNIASLGSLVQANATVDISVLQEFEDILNENIEALKKLKMDVKNYISKTS